MLPRVNIDIVPGVLASMQKQQEPGAYMDTVQAHMLDNNPALLLYIHRAMMVGELEGCNPEVVRGLLLGFYDQLRVQDEINELESA